MRRHLSLFLVLLLLALCGCSTDTGRNDPAASDPVDSLSMVIRDGVAEDNGAAMNSFHHLAGTIYPDRIYITRYDNGLAHDSVIEYDGSTYTITDENGTRRYQYLLYSSMVSPSDSAVFSEYYLLTNDPDMTAEKYVYTFKSSAYLLEDVPLTEAVYERHTAFDLAPVYGEVPQQIEDLVGISTPSIRVIHAENSIFMIRAQLALSSEKEAYLLERYGYDGVKQSESTVKGSPSRIMELENGGLLVFSYTFEDSRYHLLCYRPDGSVHWEHSFDEQYTSYVVKMIEYRDEIYCFGEIIPKDSDSDLCIWRFDQEGRLLHKQTFGGSDFDSISYVTHAADGFTVWGSTQSGDGDLPFSEDGFGVSFLAKISDELELVSVQETEDDYHYLDEIGTYQDSAVFAGDPILDLSLFDQFPKDASLRPIGIFAWNDGYVIVRSYDLGAWPYSNPIVNYQPNYCQLVYTGYNSQGIPLWQTGSSIYIE